jgi:anhydro-N-acetylmuramic acid kinase
MLTLGILSGTSVDAIDIALVDWQSPSPKLVAFDEFEWPKPIQTRLLALPESPQLSLAQLGELNTAVGQVFSQCIQSFISKQQIDPSTIAVVGSHGQTIWHHPQGDHPFSLQIGHAAIIAKQTGIAVAADFRMDDVALSGQGAPLAPAFHEVLFAKPNESVAVLNLGGIANISLLRAQQPTVGFDTGPANTLLDAWYRQHHSDCAYDIAGNWAASAPVDDTLLTHLLAHPYFQHPLPKSTGREDFSLHWLDEQLTGFTHLSAAQVQSTLMQLTVESIAQIACQTLSPGSQIWLAGGGVMNDELMKRLKCTLAEYQLLPTEQSGYPSAAIEAMLFAWLGKQRLQAQAINLTSITGSKKPAILGGLWLP